MIPKECKMIHRPGCVPGKRDPLCYCQRRKRREAKQDTVWKSLGYKSPEDYQAWLERVASRDMPLFNAVNE